MEKIEARTTVPKAQKFVLVDAKSTPSAALGLLGSEAEPTRW